MTGRAHALDAVPGLQALARAQLGILRRDQLAAMGVNRHHVRQQVESRRWRVIGPRVVALQNGSLSRHQQMVVAVLNAGDDAHLAGPTALERDGLTGWWRSPLHVLVPRGARVPRLRDVVVHETGDLPRHHVRDGVPRSCSPARAVVDAGSWERRPEISAALVVAVLQQRLAPSEGVLEVLDAMPRARHRSAMRDAVTDYSGGSESLSEARVLRVVRRLGLGRVRRQVVVGTSSGPRRLDLVIELPDGRTLVVEVDGVHHEDPRRRRADAALDAELVRLGYVVLRIPAAACGDEAWLRRCFAPFASVDLQALRGQ